MAEPAARASVVGVISPPVTESVTDSEKLLARRPASSSAVTVRFKLGAFGDGLRSLDLKASSPRTGLTRAGRTTVPAGGHQGER